MGVGKRLLEDAESFAKEAARLDDERFVQRTLEVLGIPSEQGGMASEFPEAGRIQRPAPAGPAADLLRRADN